MSDKCEICKKRKKLESFFRFGIEIFFCKKCLKEQVFFAKALVEKYRAKVEAYQEVISEIESVGNELRRNQRKAEIQQENYEEYLSGLTGEEEASDV